MQSKLLPFSVMTEQSPDEVLDVDAATEVAAAVSHHLKLQPSDHLTDAQKGYFAELVNGVTFDQITEKDRDLVDEYAIIRSRIKFVDEQIEVMEQRGVVFNDKDERGAYKTVMSTRKDLNQQLIKIRDKLRVNNSNYENRGAKSKAVSSIIDVDPSKVEDAEYKDIEQSLLEYRNEQTASEI